MAYQSVAAGTVNQNVFSLPNLGLRYTPPAGMKDKTSPEATEARQHAASYAVKKAELLLDMSSDESDTAPNWRRVWIFIFPRTQLASLNDAAAEVKMNAAIAGPKANVVSQPQNIVMAGHRFLVSEFELREPPLVKHAKIFTMICKGQLVSFVLVSNSGAQVQAMEESLKTLEVSSH
jgi:hypothetical protein